MAVQSYRQLIAWQKAMELVKYVYDLTKKFPREELYGLTLQIRKAVVSVPSNIAEGQGRNSTKEFLHYLFIAYGSLMETETQGLVAEMQKLYYGGGDNRTFRENRRSGTGGKWLNKFAEAKTF